VKYTNICFIRYSDIALKCIQSQTSAIRASLTQHYPNYIYNSVSCLWYSTAVLYTHTHSFCLTIPFLGKLTVTPVPKSKLLGIDVAELLQDAFHVAELTVSKC